MGQKCNPTGLRIGVIKNWDSRWYAKKADFGDTLVEDHNLRKYLLETLKGAGVPKVEIERDAKRVRINIHCAKPGMVIGKQGAEIEKLKASRVQESELGIHISQVRTELAMSQESPRSRMNANARAVLFRGKIESLKHASDAVAAVGPDSIQKFASEYLDPSLASLCLVGPVGRRVKARWEKKLNELRQNR